MFGFLGSYAQLAKWVIIGLLALGVVYGVNKVYRTIQENAVLEQKVTTLTQAVKEREDFIKLTADIAKAREQAIVDRDKEIAELQTRLDGLLENLPPEADNQSSDTLKEIARRLREARQ